MRQGFVMVHPGSATTQDDRDDLKRSAAINALQTRLNRAAVAAASLFALRRVLMIPAPNLSAVRAHKETP